MLCRWGSVICRDHGGGVAESIKEDEEGKSDRLDEVQTDMQIVAGEVVVSWTRRLFSVCMREGSILEDWRTVLIVLITEEEW